jgi:hypothetical protein
MTEGDAQAPAEVQINDPDLPPPVHEEPTRFFTDIVIRGLLALAFAGFFLITIVWGFMLAGDPDKQVWEQTRQLLDSLVPAVTALLGSVVGFYFGTQKAP